MAGEGEELVECLSISLWYPEDFRRYKAATCVAHTEEGYTMCLALMNGVFVPPPERVRFEISGDHIDIVDGP